VGTLTLPLVTYQTNSDLDAENLNAYFFWQQQRLLKWQLAHPNGISDECIEWMKQSQSKRQKVESNT
jgi:hypothetical protein